MTEATLTIDPPPPARIWAAARQDSANGAVRLRSSTRAKASVLDFSAGAGGAGAGVVDEPVEAPVALQHRLDQALAIGRLA